MLMDKIKLLLIGLLLCLAFPSRSADNTSKPDSTLWYKNKLVSLVLKLEQIDGAKSKSQDYSFRIYSSSFMLPMYSLRKMGNPISGYNDIILLDKTETISYNIKLDTPSSKNSNDSREGSESKDLFLYSLLGVVILLLLFLLWLLCSKINSLKCSIEQNNKDNILLLEQIKRVLLPNGDNYDSSFDVLNKKVIEQSDKLSTNFKNKTQPEVKRADVVVPLSLPPSSPIIQEETVSVIYCGLPSKDMILFKATSDDSRRFIVEGTGDIAFLTIIEEYAKALLESHDALRGVVEIKEGNRSATVSKITVLQKGKVRKMDQDRWKVTDPIEIRLS